LLPEGGTLGSGRPARRNFLPDLIFSLPELDALLNGQVSVTSSLERAMMKFTALSLRQTSDQFRNSCRELGIQVAWETGFNLWAQIVTEKDYSAAVSQANRHETINAVAVNADRIISAFKHRGRDITSDAAHHLFAEAIRETLPDISACMYKLRQYIASVPGSCLEVLTEGIGIFEQDKPGYLPIEQVLEVDDHNQELNWIRSSAELVVDVINSLTGVPEERKHDIISASMREGFKKNEIVFVYYFKKHVYDFSATLAKLILEKWPDPDEWDCMDYDTVSYCVYDVIEVFCRRGAPDFNSWLKPDCDIGEALLDHVTARVRDGLRIFADSSNDLLESLTGTIEFAAKKILR
jgi:hypothetical protein